MGREGLGEVKRNDEGEVGELRSNWESGEFRLGF